MAQEGKQVFVSLNPETFVIGGLINDVDVKFDNCRWEMWDYNGAIKTPELFFRADLTVLDGGDVFEGNWSCGKQFEPNEDGSRVVPVAGATHMVKGTNFDALLNSLVNNCDMPKDKLDQAGGVHLLNGLEAHIIRIPAPERAGLERAAKEGGYKPTIPVCSKLISFPWEAKGKKKGAPKATAGTAPAAAERVSPAAAADVSAKAKVALDEVLGKVEAGTMKLSDAKVLCFRGTTNEDKDVRNAIVKTLGDEEWLIANGFLLDGENVSKI